MNRRCRRPIAPIPCRGRGRRLKTVDVAAGEDVRAIVDAIDYAAASYPVEVRIAADTWEFGSNEYIDLDDYVSLRGVGDDQSILYAFNLAVDLGNGSIVSGIRAEGYFQDAGVAMQFGVSGGNAIIHDCDLRGQQDMVVLFNDINECVIRNCTGRTKFDGITLSTSCSGIARVRDCSLLRINEPLAPTYGMIVSYSTNSFIYAENVVVTGTFPGGSNPGDAVFQSKSFMELRNCSCDVNAASGNKRIYGVYASHANSDIHVYGGSFHVEHDGDGDARDLAQVLGALTVYDDVEYVTFSGVITEG